MGVAWTDSCPKAGFPPRTQRERAFINRGRGLHAETAQSALTVILKLVIGGLIGVFLIIITTVTLQLQSVCSGFLEARSRILGGVCHGCSLTVVWFTSSAWWGFPCLEERSQDVAQNVTSALEQELKVLGFAQ